MKYKLICFYKKEVFVMIIKDYEIALKMLEEYREKGITCELREID